MSQWIAGVTRGHNGSVCLLKDGEIVFYVEEERLTGRKYDGSPFAGLLKIKDYTDKIDYLVISGTNSASEAPQCEFIPGDIYTTFAIKIGLIKSNPTELNRNDGFIHPQVYDTGRIHHNMHAAVAFYNSGFEEAACLVVDGCGSVIPLDNEIVGFECESIFKASYPNNFEEMYKTVGSKRVGVRGGVNLTEYYSKTSDRPEVIIHPNAGITKVYEAMTEYCDFHFIEAGKAMGLAPYGKQNKSIPKLFGKEENGFLSDLNVVIPNYPNGAYINNVANQFLRDKSLDKMKDLAYATQKETQEQVLRLIKKAIDITGLKNIVLSGGYGLNCVANYFYLSNIPEGVKIYIEPVSHDGGTSIGAAKWLHHKITDDMTVRKQQSIYYGPKYNYTVDQVKSKLYENEKISDVTKEDIVDILRNKNIVAMFQGGSEAGPRALGNRTLLFDPTVENGKDLVNQVKHREWFRPFAGTIMQEYVHDWFNLRGMDETPFMMYAVNCQEGVKEKIPSIIHVDGTCRIQTVTKEQNKHFYELIGVFNEKTGVPILFNTSFNLGGDPLVETIDDALNTLRRSDIQYLYLPELEKLITVSS